MKDLEKLAEQIYSILYGDIDSKLHRAQVAQEIEDWLTDSDLSDNATAATLAVEYMWMLRLAGPE